jgi:dCTP deaminase
MILSNVELQAALDAGRLILRPEPQPRRPEEGRECPYGTHSVDLTLAAELSFPASGPYSYDLMQPGSLADFIARNSQKHVIDERAGYPLARNQFVLGRTLEWVGLPIRAGDVNCLAARIEGKSSRARCGILVHFTAPTVHPGFEGFLTLEIINLGPAPFVLRPRMPIAQLIVEEVRGIPFEIRSQFHGQTTPEGAPDQP